MPDPVLGITEQWDTDALIEIRDSILKPAQCPPLPQPLRLRTGAVPGTKGTSQKVLGYYVSPDKAEDNVPSFYVSPLVGDTVEALTVLTWLATFAAFPDDDWKPRSNRSHLAERLGFLHPYTTPKAGSTLRVQLEEVATSLVKARPHSAIDVSKTPIIKTQSTNLLAGECLGCHGKHRLTFATLIAGWPECTGNGTHQRYLVNVVQGNKANGFYQVDPHNYRTGINLVTNALQQGIYVDVFEPV